MTEPNAETPAITAGFWLVCDRGSGDLCVVEVESFQDGALVGWPGDEEWDEAEVAAETWEFVRRLDLEELARERGQP